MTDVKITRVTEKDGRYYYIEDLPERHPDVIVDGVRRKGRPKQKWHKLTRVEEGEAALLEAVRAFKAQRAGPRKGDLPTHMATFVAEIGPTRKSYQTRRDYERMCDIVGAKLEQFNVREVGPEDIDTFLARFNTKPAAKRSYRACLSTFFSWCVLHQRTTGVIANPVREIKLKKQPKRKRKIRNSADWFAIYDRLSPKGQCFADLCFLMTARPTEIRLLDEAQIFDGLIHFTPTKTEDSSGESIDWPVTAEIERVLERARKLNKVRALPGRSCPVIQNDEGEFYGTVELGKEWRAATAAAKLPDVTTRDIRPYALVCAEQRGYDLRALQHAAAHANANTTQGYLDQYRDAVSPVRLSTPERPKT